MASFLDNVADFLGFGNVGATESAQQTLDDMLALAQTQYGQTRGMLDDYYRQMQGIYGEGASQYGQAVANLADAIANAGTYDKTVQDFLDPAREQRSRAAMNAINNAASASGQRFSSGYLDKLAAKQQALASDEWRSAYDRLMQDRQQQLQQAQVGVQNLGTLANIYGNDRNMLAQALGDYTGNLANLGQSQLQMQTDIMGQQANLEAQKKGGLGAIIGGLTPAAEAVASFF